MNPDSLIVLQLTAAQTVGVVLFLAGSVKVFDRGGTLDAVRAYQIVPVRVARVVAVVLPWLELAAAGSLMTGVMLTWGASLAVALLILFTVVLVITLARGKQVPCGCFGAATDDVVSWGKVAANIVLLVVCQPAVFAAFSPEWPGQATSLSFAPAFLARLFTSIVVVQVISLKQLRENGRLQRESWFGMNASDAKVPT